jgi:hypothetical protein
MLIVAAEAVAPSFSSGADIRSPRAGRVTTRAAAAAAAVSGCDGENGEILTTHDSVNEAANATNGKT